MKIKIRQVSMRDLEQCCRVESESYENKAEAASRGKIAKRIKIFPEGFLVAEVDGRVVGLINSTSTNKEDLSDEDLKDMVDFEEDGKSMVIFSVAVHPDFQGKGISKPLMNGFIEKSRELGKGKILLICQKKLIRYYEQYGFVLIGKSASTHGGSEWHEMYLDLK